MDNRLCLNVNAEDRSQKIVSFINSAVDRLDIYAFIISGSSISASIRDILNVEKEHHHARTELDIYRNTVPHLRGRNIYLGDYTVVSPYYSDVDIPKEAMQNVTAPKVIYSYGSNHYIARGGAIKTHKRGLHQYNDIAAHIVKQPFYRTPGYSYGDNFIYLKSLGQGNKVTPGSILKPTINLHITYMLRDFTI
ncbi:beta family protein [Bordetella trematum]|uniref:beta family protein n=1 Tax=Bordetella trematum TaxID=123899 RepID=UPI003AF3B655